jgi:hypothetical protein
MKLNLLSLFSVYTVVTNAFSLSYKPSSLCLPGNVMELIFLGGSTLLVPNCLGRALEL